jgi:hypothetical protein
MSTGWRNFHHTVAGMTFGPIDTLYLIGGVAVVAGGLYATVALRGSDEPAVAAALAPETVTAD